MVTILHCACFVGLFLGAAHSAPSTEHVVYPRLLEARDGNAEKMLHIQPDIILRLQKTSVLADTFVFSKYIDGTRIDTPMDGKKLEANLYHDRTRMASVTVEDRNGAVEVNGILSETLRIAPLLLDARAADGPIPHKIFQVQQRPGYRTDYAAFPEARSSSEIFYAELKIVVDSYHSDAFKNDTALIVYLATCMKLVNIRYEDTSSPMVQFLLTTVELAKPNFTEVFVSYDVECRYRSQKWYMDPVKMINKTVEEYGRSQEDIVIFLTGVDLADQFDGIVYNYVMGQAKFRGFCSPDRRVAIVEDTPPTYALIQVMAHELAHTLGANHDGDEPTTGMPTDRCKSGDGYMMAPSAHGSNHGHFSNCSIVQIREFIKNLTAECKEVKLNTTHHRNHTVILPGKDMNLTNYCKQKHPNFPNITATQEKVGKDCRFKCCPDDYPCFHETAVDGMPCDDGKKICFRNQCGDYPNQKNIYVHYPQNVVKTTTKK